MTCTDLLAVCRTALDVRGRLQVRLEEQENNTWIGYIEDPRLTNKDDIGALYYVIAVIFIYGLSIVMMIASHIRKNKQDCQLRAYLKEMANLRKADRREKLMGRITSIANATSVKGLMKEGGDKEGGGTGAGTGGGVWKNLARIGSKTSKSGSRPGSLKATKGRGASDSSSRQREEEDETGDSDFLPVDFALEMNHLTPSATPMTTPSATPSPPPRHILKPNLKSKSSYTEDSFSSSQCAGSVRGEHVKLRR
ncbi:hypothetical protein BaRGS_00000665, partial [Batillaria attramentaria]